MQFPLRQRNRTLRFYPLTLFGFSPNGVLLRVKDAPLLLLLQSCLLYNRNRENAKLRIRKQLLSLEFFYSLTRPKEKLSIQKLSKKLRQPTTQRKSVFLDRKNGAANYEIYARKRGQNANIMRRLFARYYKFFLFQNFLQLDSVYIEYGTVFANALIFAVCALANAHKARAYAATHSLFKRNETGNSYIIFL